MKKTPVDLEKRFPIHHAYPKYLAADFCGLAIHLDHGKVEVTPVDWEREMVHCVLTQHPYNLSSHSYNSLHSVVPEFWLLAPYSCCGLQSIFFLKVTFLQFFHVSHIPDTSFTKSPMLF